jgi:MoxR-like ATPase
MQGFCRYIPYIIIIVMVKKEKNVVFDVKKISPTLLLRLINKAKKYLKEDDVMQSVFKEYNIDINEIDFIPTYFKHLDVAAKTDHAIVWLNYALLDNFLDKKKLSYLIHEYTHWLQQTTGNKPTKSSNVGDYLQNPFEQEGFQNQIEFICKEYGEQEAENYVDHLLDHHEIYQNTERNEKKEILTAKI